MDIQMAYWNKSKSELMLTYIKKYKNKNKNVMVKKTAFHAFTGSSSRLCSCLT